MWRCGDGEMGRCGDGEMRDPGCGIQTGRVFGVQVLPAEVIPGTCVPRATKDQKLTSKYLLVGRTRREPLTRLDRASTTVALMERTTVRRPYKGY